METKTFSVKDGSLRIHQDNIRLYSSMHDEGGRIIIASTDINDVVNYGLFKLPSTLIRKPKTDEELAEKYPVLYEWDEFCNRTDNNEDCRNAFLYGRKSVGGEFHLTREELERFAENVRSHRDFGTGSVSWDWSIDDCIDGLIPPIYPTTITVEHDGNNYLWETLIPSYE